MRNQILLELSPGEPFSVQDRLDLIRETWQEWTMSGDPGATSWDVLEGIQARVTDYLYYKPPDVESAESLTAKAFLLRQG